MPQRALRSPAPLALDEPSVESADPNLGRRTGSDGRGRKAEFLEAQDNMTNPVPGTEATDPGSAGLPPLPGGPPPGAPGVRVLQREPRGAVRYF